MSHLDMWNTENVSKEELEKEYTIILGKLTNNLYEMSTHRHTRRLTEGRANVEKYTTVVVDKNLKPTGKKIPPKKAEKLYSYNDFDLRIAVLIVEGSKEYEVIENIKQDAYKKENIKCGNDVDNDKETQDKIDQHIRSLIMTNLTHQNLVDMRNKAYEDGKVAGEMSKVREIRNALNL